MLAYYFLLIAIQMNSNDHIGLSTWSGASWLYLIVARDSNCSWLVVEVSMLVRRLGVRWQAEC
jgi:hypothetical protein